MLRRSMLCAVSLAALAAPMLVAPNATAQTTGAWPERPIRLVLPFPPGGPSDMAARLAGEKLQLSLKQPVVVENKAGAGGNLGTAEVTRAAPDGYTWMIGTDTILTVNPHVYKQLGFKVEALAPIALATAFNQTLVCNPAVGVKTLRELIAKAKASPMAYASGGPGVPGHLSMELLQHMAGFDMNHIPYRGPAPATQDVLAGQVPCGLLAGPTVLPHVRAGKLVALAVSGSERSPTLPDVPTMAEAGVPGYEANFKLVLYAPQGINPAIVERFRQAFVDALKSPDVVEQLNSHGLTPQPGSRDELAKYIAKESATWGRVIRERKITGE